MKAKELIPHGEFQAWLEANSGGRDIRTVQRYMKLAKTTLESFLTENPKLKGLQDAYVAAGVLPEAETKVDAGEEKEKPLFTLNFKTQYHHPSEWSRDAARDFLYEFDRIARIAMQLKTEFGL